LFLLDLKGNSRESQAEKKLRPRKESASKVYYYLFIQLKLLGGNFQKKIQGITFAQKAQGVTLEVT
jgi:hypothetical protein